MTISRITSVPVVITTAQTNAAQTLNHWDSLRLSDFYANYAPMYDQVKFDKIRVKITGNQAGTAQTTNISPAVVLAFDRNGTDANQQLTASVVSTYSSAQMKQWSSGNALTMYQTIYPSSIMEKGFYVPTASLLDPSSPNNVGGNPCYNLTSPAIPFKPITFIAVNLGFQPTSNQTFAFTVELEYTVTFRGMRKPSLSYSDSILVPLSRSITANGNYTILPTDVQEDADGFSNVQLAVNVPTLTPTSIGLTGNITNNGTYTVLPSQYNVDYFSGVQLTVNVTNLPISIGSISTDYETISVSSGFTYNATQTTTTIGSTIYVPFLVMITNSTDHYLLRLYTFPSQTSTSFTIPADRWVAFIDANGTNYVSFKSGGDTVFRVRDQEVQDANPTMIYIYKSFIYFPLGGQ